MTAEVKYKEEIKTYVKERATLQVLEESDSDFHIVSIFEKPVIIFSFQRHPPLMIYCHP